MQNAMTDAEYEQELMHLVRLVHCQQGRPVTRVPESAAAKFVCADSPVQFYSVRSLVVV